MSEKEVKSSKKSQPSCQSLARGLRIIDILASYPDGCPLAKISEEAGLNKSTVHRLLQELISNEYVQNCINPGNYRLTSKLLVIGHNVVSSTNIYNVITPHLERLNFCYSQTVNFSMRDNDHAILLYKLNPSSSLLKTRTSIGQSMPLYCTAMGKVYLAFSDDASIDAYIINHQHLFNKITENTLVDPAALKNEIINIRHSLIAFDNEENELGISCIAAPIFDLNNENVYAISLSATTKRLESLGIDKVKEHVLKTAAAISKDLGCADYFKNARSAV